MKKILLIGSMLCLWAAGAAAAVLQDWTVFTPKENVGTFVDEKGTKIEIAQSEGPAAGQKALKMSVALAEWGGVWTAVKGNLPKTGALRFKAKASAPGLLEVGITDGQKTQYVAQVRVFSEDWEEFTVPYALFKKTKYPMPDAPKNAVLDLAKIVGVQFSPRTAGTTTYWVGPVVSVAGPAKAMTGMPKHNAAPGTLVVQDFTLVDKKCYGVFTDDKGKTSLQMDVVRDPDNNGRQLAAFRYGYEDNGWCGVWMRCGDEWEGQDWKGARTLVFTIYTKEPISLEFGFNDANENAYVALAPQTKGTGWETLFLPFSSFQLNPYYQPSEANKGVAQDISRIETFNISPKTKGKHEFKLREVLIKK